MDDETPLQRCASAGVAYLCRLICASVECAARTLWSTPRPSTSSRAGNVLMGTDFSAPCTVRHTVMANTTELFPLNLESTSAYATWQRLSPSTSASRARDRSLA